VPDQPDGSGGGLEHRIRGAGQAYDGHVIGSFQLMIGVFAGMVLIALGVVPGLFQRLVDGVQDGVQNFANLLSSQFPGPSRLHEELPRPKWLAGLGAALIAATVLAYLSR
jgi:hypothetical protein